MKIYNSSLGEKIELTPINDGEIRIYICGPTVYDDAHLGHARSAVSFDLLIRFLEILGYKVIDAKNFTDIDDKLIAKCKETNTPLKELSQKYIDRYLYDMSCIGVRRAKLEPRATNFIESISSFIKDLLDRGIAYKLENGDIYLEVSKDLKYGSLSGHFENKDSVHRIQLQEGKKDSRDFVLWKAYKGEGDIGFDSILGKGRPGWHIECSSMIDSMLSYKDKEFCIDIHAGGMDLFFPHHENEACQTRCLRNKEIAKYWMHNGFVNINGEKMSKSLGNSFFMKDALSSYHGEILRNYLLGTHYRLPLNFNEEDLIMSKKRLDRIYRLKKRIDFISNDRQLLQERESEQYMRVLGNLREQADKDFIKDFFDALSDDLNISLALSVIEEFIKNANEHLDSNPKDKAYKNKVKSNLDIIDFVLGLGNLNYVKYFQLGVDNGTKDRINKLVEDRVQAKKNKDYALADSIRGELESIGIAIMDKPGGITEWEKIL